MTVCRPKKRSRTTNGVAKKVVCTRGVATMAGVATTVGAATTGAAVATAGEAATVAGAVATAGAATTVGTATTLGTKLVTTTVGTNGVTKLKLLKWLPTTAADVTPQAGAFDARPNRATRANRVRFIR